MEDRRQAPPLPDIDDIPPTPKTKPPRESSDFNANVKLDVTITVRLDPEFFETIIGTLQKLKELS